MARLEGPDFLHFKWANQRNVYASKFHYLFEQERWVDVTLLSADGQFLKAHRLILSASSQYFEDIFMHHHPQLDYLDTLPAAEVTLEHIGFHDLKLLIEYMYKGEVNVTREQLPSFMEAAATLKIKELIEQAQEMSTAENPHSMDPTPSLSASQSPTQSNTLLIDDNNFIIMKDAENVLGEFDDSNADPPLQLKLLDNHHGELMDDTPNPNCSQELQLSESSDEFEELDHFTRRNIPEDYATGVETENQTKAKWNKFVKATREGSDKLKHQESQRKSLRLTTVNSSKGNAPLAFLSDDSEEEEDNSSSKDTSDDDEPPNEAATTSAVPKRKANKGSSGSKLAKKVRKTPDERPFECCKCGRSYKRKNHLSRHSRYECGVEPGYPCPLCDFRAKRRDKLQDHLVRFHEVDPSQLKVYNAEPKFSRSRQPHKCIKCSRTFKQKMNLERHLKDECRAQ